MERLGAAGRIYKKKESSENAFAECSETYFQDNQGKRVSPLLIFFMPQFVLKSKC